MENLRWNSRRKATSRIRTPKAPQGANSCSLLIQCTEGPNFMPFPGGSRLVDSSFGTSHNRNFPFRKQQLPCGLKNLKNSCYMNSVLQILAFTPFFASLCIDGKHLSNCPRIISECLVCLLQSTVQTLLSTDEDFLSPNKLYELLIKSDNDFQEDVQEDAHECLLYLLNACQGLEERSSDSSISDYQVPNIKDFFGGEVRSTLRCSLCKAESEHDEESLDISLDISSTSTQVSNQKQSVFMALDRFASVERLDEEKICNCCQRVAPFEKSLSIRKAPRLLVMQLKRYSGRGKVKIRDKIPFRSELSLGHCMSKNNTDSNPLYELYGVICHKGRSQVSGHYVSYVKKQDSSGSWFLCNDHIVTAVLWEEVQNAEAYVLLYKRKEPLKLSGVKRARPGCMATASVNQGSGQSEREVSGKRLKRTVSDSSNETITSAMEHSAVKCAIDEGGREDLAAIAATKEEEDLKANPEKILVIDFCLDVKSMKSG